MAAEDEYDRRRRSTVSPRTNAGSRRRQSARRIGQSLGFIKVDPVRTLYINGIEPSDVGSYVLQSFPDNEVVTSKYTIFNFIPKNLFEQLRRVANFYFLCISILQFAIEAPVSPATTLAPLCFVLFVTAVKQAYEDWLRHKSDDEVNKYTVRILQDGKLRPIMAAEIKVGNIVYVEDHGNFPCDLLLLSSSDPKGDCYITTAGLDGETNIKMMHPVESTKHLTDLEVPVTATSVIENLVSFLVLYNYTIPVSMYVTVELQKFIGVKFFEWDLDMYREDTDEPAKANTSDLNEELGQIEYLMTDKTGTLTENEMKFKYCSIDGVQYHEQAGRMIREDGYSVESFSPIEKQFLRVLALCHTAHINTGEDGKMEFQSSSPDEKALLEFCERIGVLFKGKDNDGYYCVEMENTTLHYQLLETLEFDSTRKCMSVIVRNVEIGEVLLLCKGAEAALQTKCISGDLDMTLSHLTGFAEKGLRTLLVAMRVLSEKELAIMLQKLHVAKTSLQDRQEKISKVYLDIEKDFHLLGATGVEDRLQDGVPETLRDLNEAGIRVWILTGDKEETAVNISYSCGHFTKANAMLKLTGHKNLEEMIPVMQEIEEKINEIGNNAAFIVDGQSLAFALLEPEGKMALQRICMGCRSVLCCRMSPLQKSQVVVKMVRESPGNPVVAAIGDGGNDASMIQEADVGIGIFGKEGRQAARVADFAFGRFHFLRRALLVHGFLYYSRIAILVQYFFYKNSIFVNSQIWFSLFNGFSAQTIHDALSLTAYNLTYTSLPIFMYGLLEQKYSTEKLSRTPALYKLHRHNSILSWKNFWFWFVNAIWHNIVCFFGTSLFFYITGGAASPDAQVLGFWAYGAMVITSTLLLVNAKLFIETCSLTRWTIAGYAITIGAFFAFISIWNGIYSPLFGNEENYWAYFKIYTLPFTWAFFLLVLGGGLLPDIAAKVIRNMRDKRRISDTMQPDASNDQQNDRKQRQTKIKAISEEENANSYQLSSIDHSIQEPIKS